MEFKALNSIQVHAQSIGAHNMKAHKYQYESPPFRWLVRTKIYNFWCHSTMRVAWAV